MRTAGLRPGQLARPDDRRAKGVEKAAAQIGCAAHNHHAAEYRAAVQVIHAAASVFTGRAAAQTGGATVGHSQGLDYWGGLAAKVEATAVAFRVHNGRFNKILRRKIAIPTALNRQRLRQVYGLAEYIAAHVDGMYAAASSGNQD